MHNILRSVVVLTLLLSARAGHSQKALIYKDASYNFSFINSFTIDRFCLSVRDFLDPFYAKDSLSAGCTLQVAVANEMGLRGLLISDGHRHGLSLEITCSLEENGISESPKTITLPFFKKMSKAGGPSVLILMEDHEKEKVVWAGCISLEKIKEKDLTLCIKKGVKIILDNYPIK